MASEAGNEFFASEAGSRLSQRSRRSQLLEHTSARSKPSGTTATDAEHFSVKSVHDAKSEKSTHSKSTKHAHDENVDNLDKDTLAKNQNDQKSIDFWKFGPREEKEKKI